MADMTDVVEYTINGTEYTVLAEQGDGGGGYEWDMVALVRSSAGQLFLVLDGGCSCYGPWDNVTAENLQPVKTWQEAVELVKANHPGFFSDDDVAQFAEQLMKLRPAPSKS